MNPSTTALTLNLQLPNIATVSWAVQGDQLSRVITATLLDGSTAWTPQAAYHGVIRYHKPDGTSGVYDVDEDGNPAVTWSGNVATIKIVQQALTVPGSVMMQLEFYDANSARVSAFGWINNVQPSAVTDNEFLSADYYNILSLQIAAVLGAETHPPYIDDTTHDWMVWDTTVNDYVDSGVYAIGPVGPPPTVTATGNQYANSTSGTTPPSSWSDTRPAPVQGQWSWTKTTVVFDTGTSTFYTAAYQGIDGGGNPGTATPLMDGTAAVGTSAYWAHEDHRHPTDDGIPTISGALANKNVLLIGDSISNPEYDANPSWSNYFETMLSKIGSTLTTVAYNGRGYSYAEGGYNFLTVMQTLTLTDYDVIIVFGGINDFYDPHGISLGQLNQNTAGRFCTNVNSVNALIKSSGALGVIVSPIPTKNTRADKLSLGFFGKALCAAAKRDGLLFVDGGSFPFLPADGSALIDSTHPISAVREPMARHIFDKIVSGGDTRYTNEDLIYAPGLSANTGDATYNLRMFFVDDALFLGIAGTVSTAGVIRITLPPFNVFLTDGFRGVVGTTAVNMQFNTGNPGEFVINAANPAATGAFSVLREVTSLSTQAYKTVQYS